MIEPCQAAIEQIAYYGHYVVGKEDIRGNEGKSYKEITHRCDRFERVMGPQSMQASCDAKELQGGENDTAHEERHGHRSRVMIKSVDCDQVIADNPSTHNPPLVEDTCLPVIQKDVSNQ